MKAAHYVHALLVLASCALAGEVRAQDAPSAGEPSRPEPAASVAPVGPRRLPVVPPAAGVPAYHEERVIPADRLATRMASSKRAPMIGALAGGTLGGLFVFVAAEEGSPRGVGDIAPYVLGGAAIGALVGLLVSNGG
ncbi:MAG TPA: hypothetical protein VHG28_02985 [Longimicrobiaceae bacterium]|nr:hypothetical protein [Longimicrobiaceae bacterium]